MDPFLITPPERARFEAQFNTLKPIGGIVTGDQAKGFFLQSQLPPPILGVIWGLADTDADGKMNINEFSIACKLINLKLRGFEVPKVLPPALAQLAHQHTGMPPTGNLLQSNIVPVMPIKPPVPPAPIPPAPLARPMISPPSGGGTPAIPALPIMTQPVVTSQPLGMPPTIPPLPIVQPPPLANIPPLVPPVLPTASVPPSSTLERAGSLESPLGAGTQFVEWAVPHASKLKYTQLFNTTDRTRSGFLTGVQARSIMMSSQLPQPVLAQIWGLSDMDADGRLSCEEFVLAMHLCDLARSGEKIQVPLPQDLIPPTLRRQRQNSLTVTNPEQGDPLAGLSSVTFEDKRKENFEKGQAELERRRKALLEIQRKEQEERERKEREEQEKREKIRLEQEKRRQQELEKQLQKQRELEQEREEQRRRAQEQREAARREMERQRQLEWEKQRSLELQAQRQREQENVLKMKAKNQNLSIELSQLNEKVKELSSKISETRSGVTSVKTTIDGMRTTRDTQLSQMSALKTRLKEHNARLVAVSQEKTRLEAKNKMNAAADGIGQEQAQIAFNNKQITLKHLREKLEDMEKQITVKLEDIENNNSQLGDLKKELSTLIKECEGLYSEYNEKRTKVLEMKGVRSGSITGWGDAAWNSTPSAWPEEATTNGDSNYRKYRALYEFVARNSDELSFQPGDIIMVPAHQTAEPGWLAGELRGATGWFPEAYVEPVGSVAAAFPAEADTLHNKTQLEEITEVPENVSDNGSAVVEVTSEAGPPVPTMPSLVLGLGTAVDMRVVALYTFTESAPDQLGFTKGDIIRVTENQDIWWYGEFNNNEGWFPKTYVKLATDNININNIHPPPVSTSGAEMLPPEEQEYYVSVYPYQSVESGDLTFNQGEVVLVTKKDGDWWTGVIADRTGIFPSNYVQKADTQPVVSPVVEEPVVVVEQKAPEPVNLEPKVMEVRAVTPDFSTLTAQLEGASSGGEDSDSKGSKGKKPEIATVIAPYQATSSEQLSLQRGQLIMIRKKTTTGWWEGELQAKGKKRQIGWFPASYVKLLGGGSTSTPPPTAAVTASMTIPQAAPLSNRTDQAVGDSIGDKVIALYQYKALNPDELSFEKDDVITLLSKDEPAWWRGELNNTTGLFPSNYVAPLSNSVKRKIKLSKDEKKRQHYIKELILTEQAYIDDMSVVHDVFEKPLRESRVLSPEQISKIFVNWRDIIVCNYMFLRSLRVRREMSEDGIIRMIGDILCENLPRMTVYVRFCSCQLSAASLLQKLTEESFDFRTLSKTCQSDPRTKGMPLSSFLIKPMQRITKYPLIIQKILEHTPIGHPDRQYLEEALSKAEEFCIQIMEKVLLDYCYKLNLWQSESQQGIRPTSPTKLLVGASIAMTPSKGDKIDHARNIQHTFAVHVLWVNEGVREKENSDRLEWLQTHVVCEGLTEPLVFNSLTNSVGPRKFLNHGVLTKSKSGKELVSFLLNDMLLLTQPNRPLLQPFSFERHSSFFFRIYKEPLLLSATTILNTPVTPDSLEIKLEHNRIIYSLNAVSHNDRTLWLKKINEAQKEVLHNDKCKLQKQQSKQAQFGAVGRILVVVLEGQRLKPPPIGGKREIYCEVSMGYQENRTSVSTTSGSETKWNASMQFLVKNMNEDVLCVTVLDKGYFSPDEFLGRTEIRVSDILSSTMNSKGPIIKFLPLYEVESGEIHLKLDLRLFETS